MQDLRLGVDVGGTNTDAVVLDERGHVLASGSRRIGIDFQNEYLIARDVQTGEALATVPDLICLIHPETGEPLTTEVLRYGYQVAVLAIAAPGPLKSPAALAMVGPQAFGYSNPYRPLPGDLCAAAAEEQTDWTSTESLRRSLRE